MAIPSSPPSSTHQVRCRGVEPSSVIAQLLMSLPVPWYRGTKRGRAVPGASGGLLESTRPVLSPREVPQRSPAHLLAVSTLTFFFS